MSRTRRATAGYVFSVLQFGAQILLQAVLAPVILRYAGRETLGTFAIISQSLASLALLDFGFSLTIDRFLSQSFGAADEGKRFRDVFTIARTFTFLSNTLLALVVFAFSRYVGSFFNLSPEGALEAKRALEIVAAWTFIRTPLVQFVNALIGVQDLAFVNGFSGLINGVRLIFSLILVRMHWGLVGLTIAGITAEALAGLVFRYRFKRLYPEWMPAWGIPKTELFREMFSFGTQSMFIKGAEALIYNSGNLIVGRLAGPAAVSSYYSTYMPGFYSYNLVLKLSDNSAPAINELYARNESIRLRNSFVTIHKATATLALIGAGGIILFTRKLIHLWVGDQQYGGDLFTYVIACFAVMVSVLHVNIIYSLAFGWIRLLTIVAVCEGVLNVLLGFWLGRRLGIAGVLLATLIVNTPKSIYLCRKITQYFSLGFIGFVQSAFVIPLVFVTGAFAVTAWIMSRLIGDTWATLLVTVSIYLALTAVASLGVPSREERASLVSMIRSTLMRKKLALQE